MIRVTECLRCEMPMVTGYGSRKQARAEGVRRHGGRGLCTVCHRRLQRAGELEDYPERLTTPELVEEVSALLGSRPASSVLEALEMSPASLSRRMYRAGRADLARPFEAIAGHNRRSGAPRSH